MGGSKLDQPDDKSDKPDNEIGQEMIPVQFDSTSMAVQVSDFVNFCRSHLFIHTYYFIWLS